MYLIPRISSINIDHFSSYDFHVLFSKLTRLKEYMYFRINIFCPPPHKEPLVKKNISTVKKRFREKRSIENYSFE